MIPVPAGTWSAAGPWLRVGVTPGSFQVKAPPRVRPAWHALPLTASQVAALIGLPPRAWPLGTARGR